MSTEPIGAARLVPAVHGARGAGIRPAFEAGLAEALRSTYGRDGLVELYGRFAQGEGMLDSLLRRMIVRAAARRCGDNVQIGSGAAFRHLETLEFGDDVFIGSQAIVQGRYDGTCHIGRRSWIGPHAFIDARSLFIGEDVGWGPGAKILGSEHVGIPLDMPIISTDLAIRPVHIEDWADIGTNAVVLPGVTIGKGAIVGAGAVVVSDVAPFSVVAGVPARFLRWRTDQDDRSHPRQGAGNA